jgi:hypothetical protein
MTTSPTETPDPYVLTADGIVEAHLRQTETLLPMVSSLAVGFLGVYTLLDVFGVTIA